MNEETISKVLTGETDIAKMSHDDFVEMLKCLGRMYFSRVMNCVDGTGKSDKEWTALSCIFSRVVEAITEKPSGNSAALREALEPWVAFAEWLLENAGKDGLGKAIQENGPIIRQRLEELRDALAATPRNCDVGTAEEQAERYMNFCHNYPKCTGCPCVGRVQYHQCEFVWAQLPYEEGGAT